MYKLSSEALQDFLKLGRELVAKGELPESELFELAEIEKNFRDHDQESWDNYSFFFEHFPADDADHALLILKGHLLIERKTRQFIEERLLNPSALASAQLTANHCIALGESLCLPGPNPANLWGRIRKLNKLRNTLAHNLEPKELPRRIEEFLSDFPQEGAGAGSVGERLGKAIRFLYGEISGLVDLAREEEFRIPQSGRRS